MKLTRRQFLASSAALSVAVAIPVGLLPAEKTITTWYVSNRPRNLTNDEGWLEVLYPSCPAIGTSWGNPFRSLLEAATSVRLGDTVYVGDAHLTFDDQKILLPRDGVTVFQNCFFEPNPIDKIKVRGVVEVASD